MFCRFTILLILESQGKLCFRRFPFSFANKNFTLTSVCLAAWCITGREPIGDLFRVKPWYLLLGGAIGAFITITVIWSMAGLGPAKAAMLIVISQLAAAWLIELFGLFGMEKTDFTVRKLIGMATPWNHP